ncbi:polycystic kidney disease 2-like 1 protein isoform X2 [Drosophila innubila]|uniref:polycystic kidney disease 2-like 1 protein isoform X2 n=1 Tax=Drosophila innubila TaxID=198719 RepID=UPI00148C48CB|nr:polycystic kidney disease 2-like 1 protein isoform X2 [Drosophila innubila]
MSDDDQPAPSHYRKKPGRPPPPQRPGSDSRQSAPPIQPRSVRLPLPVGVKKTNVLRMAVPKKTREDVTDDEAPSTSTRDSQTLKVSRRVHVKLPEKEEAQPLDSNQETPTSPPTRSDKLLKFLNRRKSPTVDNPDESSQQSSWRRRPTLHRNSPTARIKTSGISYTTDEEVRDALMEFAVFIAFLLLTSMVTLSVRHSYMFYFNDTMKKLFTTRELVVAPSVTVSFEKLITVPDWWDFLIYNFLVTLHGDMSTVSYDGSHVDDDEITTASPGDTTKSRKKRKRRHDATEEDDDLPDFRAFSANRTHLDGRIFLHENLLLGPPRLRQIRVMKDTCFVNDAFIRYFNTCYDSYSAGAEEIKPEHGGAAFRTMKELDSTPIWTVLNSYTTGGYTVNLTYDRDKNLKIINDLKMNHWLDRGSRLCLVEFNLYNENTDIFQSAKLIAEIPPTGGVLPQSHLQTVKHFSFITDKSLFMSVVYIFWYIMVIYYNINEIHEIRKSGFKKYFRSLLNILDSIILVVKTLISQAKVGEEYQSLDTLCLLNTVYVDMMAILAFLVWIKIFKFISFNKTLVQFTTTLKRCSKDLAGFSLMFGIVFLAYAQLGLLLFGTKHPDFRNFITSILTMMRMILGDFQYNLIEQANRVLGPIYFLTYILLVFFILLNMFLAIIMETYNTVKSEITQGRSQLGSYVYKKLAALFYFISHCGRRRRNRDTINPEPEKQEFTDDPTAAVRQETSKIQLRRNMTESEGHYFEDVPNEVNNKDMYRLTNRVSLLEEILEQLVTNMDVVLKRVEREIRKRK